MSDRAPRRRFSYRPGLDGIRALAVVAVIGYHAGIDALRGGFLGVSTFFTLSGFLITTLLLVESQSGAGVDAGAFWARRVRRLVPAAIAATLLGLAVAAASGDGAIVAAARSDALAALGYVANWHDVVAQTGYAELFAGLPPLAHLWSLSIEEQFYVGLPLLFLALRRRAQVADRVLVVASLALLASLAAAALTDDRDLLYFGTHLRAAELLVGVIAACVHHSGSFTRRGSDRARTAGAAVALAVLASLWSTTSLTDARLHPWLLLVNAIATAVVVVAALGGTPGELLGSRPLTWIGARSYGLYLYHWPLLVWVHHRGLADEPAAVGAAVLASVGLAAASHRVLETPVRQWAGPVRETMLAGVGAVAVAAAVIIGVVAFAGPRPLVDFAAARATVTAPAAPDASADGLGAAPTPGPVPTRDRPEVRRLAVFGDSTALMLQGGLASWARDEPGIEVVPGFVELGCGIARGGQRFAFGDWRPFPEHCAFDTAWPSALAGPEPDVAVVLAGLWDVVELRLPWSEGPVAIGDQRVDEFLRSEIIAATDTLRTVVDEVVWLLQPTPVAASRPEGDAVMERIPRWNDLVTDALQDRADVSFVDLAGWFGAVEDGPDDQSIRPDGTHVTIETSDLAGAWLGPAIVAALAGAPAPMPRASQP